MTWREGSRDIPGSGRAEEDSGSRGFLVNIRVILGILRSFLPNFASCGPHVPRGRCAHDTPWKSAHVYVFNISWDSQDELVRERDVIPAGISRIPIPKSRPGQNSTDQLRGCSIGCTWAENVFEALMCFFTICTNNIAPLASVNCDNDDDRYDIVGCGAAGQPATGPLRSATRL